MWSGDAMDDDDPDESRRKSIEMALAQHTSGIQAPYPPMDEDDDDDDDDDDDSDEEQDAPSQGETRGKPEAMAARLASAARLQEKMDELEAEKEEAEVVAEPVEAEDDPLDATMETVDTVATIDTKDTAPTPTPKKKSPKKKTTSTPRKKGSSQQGVSHPIMEDPVEPITNEEFENLEQLMIQFCRVPLLAEFSRPVALLHPEVGLGGRSIARNYTCRYSPKSLSLERTLSYSSWRRIPKSSTIPLT
jgi:hypothetical protein